MNKITQMALRGVPEVLFSSYACFSFFTAGRRRGSWDASSKLWARPGGSSCGKERSGGEGGEDEEEVEEEEEGQPVGEGALWGG